MSIFDFTKGGLIFGDENGNSFMSEDGHLMMKSSNSSMIDLETGETHLTSNFGENDNFKNSGFDDGSDPFKIY